MANPNIVNVTTILGNTSSVLATTANVSIVNNPASSSKIYKINSILVTNIDGVNAGQVTINLYEEDDLGGAGNSILSTVSVPADSTLIAMDKTMGIYLLEDKSIGVVADANNKIRVTTSWEEIS